MYYKHKTDLLSIVETIKCTVGIHGLPSSVQQLWENDGKQKLK